MAAEFLQKKSVLKKEKRTKKEAAVIKKEI